jgi:hypothetical protein
MGDQKILLFGGKFVPLNSFGRDEIMKRENGEAQGGFAATTSTRVVFSTIGSISGWNQGPNGLKSRKGGKKIGNSAL